MDAEFDLQKESAHARSVAAFRSPLPSDARALRQLMEGGAKQTLSERQAEVATLIAGGKSNREIATTLFLSERTVESHIAAIFTKLGVRSRTEIVATVLGAAGESAAGNARKTNVPLSLTPLIGRETEVAELTAELASARLLTLTGPGGIGKTRTAVHVAAQAAATFSDGVWLVELAPVGAGVLVAATIAQALGVSESPEWPALVALELYLRKKALLLLLDNCEHVLAEAARVTEVLLRACPRLRVFATSRESLKVAGERIYRLPPLPVPQPARGLAAAGARAYAAVALFVERASAIDRHFALTDENVADVAEICRRLDGLPLAIELAAARVKALSPKALAEKLDQRFAILTGGESTGSSRRQTLRALMDWSYDLLAPAEQLLFERLSVFSGGGSLETITVACADDSVDDIGVLDILSSLVDKSLVFAALDTSVPRYFLLESSREYAREKLVARGGFERAARQHAGAMLSLAERLEGEWDTLSQRAWCAVAGPEAANWRAALAWSIEARGDIVLGQRLAAATRLFFSNYGPAEGSGWVRQALAGIDKDTQPAVVAKLELAAASFANTAGQSKNALLAARRSLQHYRDLGDPFGSASALAVAGRALVSLGETERAEETLVRALEAARKLRHRRLTGHILSGLAFNRTVQGDVAAARAFYAEELELRNATGADADAVYAESNLAELEFQGGDARAALHHARVALARARELAETALLVVLLSNTSAYLVALGDYDAARELAREGLALAREAQLAMVVACTLQHIAASVALDEPGSTGSGRLAATLLGFVDARLNALDVERGLTERLERDQLLAALRRELGSDALAPLLAAGATLSEEEATELARSV